MTAPDQLTLLDEGPGVPVEPPAARWLEGSAPPGLRVLERWLSADEERALLAGVDAGEWRTDIARRVQQHGLRYSGRRTEHPQVVPGGLPGWLGPVVDRLEQEHALVRRAEQCNVNEYLPGQGIAAHVDVDHFGPKVALVSLASPTVMTFEPAPGTAGERAELLLPNRSLVVLDGESRTGWRHGIPKRKADRIDGVRVPRHRRVSLTFRTLADG
jgi:alkylated DNA repair dioxygenase AlkB